MTRDDNNKIIIIIIGGSSSSSSSSNFSSKYLVSLRTLPISIPDLLYNRGAQIPGTVLPRALNFVLSIIFVGSQHGTYLLPFWRLEF